MNILGLTYSNESHDTSAAIVCDGRLVAVAEEERFTRNSSLPHEALGVQDDHDDRWRGCHTFPWRAGVDAAAAFGRGTDAMRIDPNLSSA